MSPKATTKKSDEASKPAKKKAAAKPKKAAAASAKKTAAKKADKEPADKKKAAAKKKPAAKKKAGTKKKAAATSGKSLVIVESPSKAKTIKKYLGAGFDVMASVGHVKDLPKNKMGVELETGGFEPHYETIHGKGKVLQDIRRAAKTAEMVYLAPDPDREGEAIAFHIASELSCPPERIKRVLFNEVTKKAILAALDAPLELNQQRYNSQQARRILDRLVGYQISPLLWDKVRRGLSAGRVQSVAVRIVVEREVAVKAFDPVEYWNVDAMFAANDPPSFKARLAKIAGKKAELTNGEQAQAVVDAVQNGPFKVGEVKQSDRKTNPSAPFTTSRLQQDAARAFRFTAKRTMQVAQSLYEGVDLGPAGALGLITYMRTDSTRIGDEAMANVRSFIGETYGAPYLPAAPNVYKTKGRAQDAHEAIRPTDMQFSPESVEQYLKPDQFKLYSLIWKRFVACQMTPAVHAHTTIDVAAPGEHIFRATGKVLRFDGFTIVYQKTKGADEEDDVASTLPGIGVDEPLKMSELNPKQHFTKPPPRFTEATLIRELEQKGIGRPSTYAAIISTIQTKKYAEKVEQRFHPTELGGIVNELLVESFPQLFDVSFTARMENELDEVEAGNVEWKDLLGNFYGGFTETLEIAKKEMRDVKRTETPTDLKCPKCEGALVIKFGKNGSFLACSSYPDCKFTGEFTKDEDGTIKLVEEEQLGEKCPTCETGDLLYKRGKYGKFIGCATYPECRYTRPISTGVDCPRCEGKGYLTEKKSRRGKTFYSCSTYPTCDYAQWDRPIPEKCPACGHDHIDEKSTRRGKGPITCPSCGWEKPPEAPPAD